MSRPLTAAERADVAALSGMAAVAVPNRMSAVRGSLAIQLFAK